MTTIYVKNVSKQLYRNLQLKVELGCRTWSELLEKLVDLQRRRKPTKDNLTEMKGGVENLLKLRTVVSNKWKGDPTVVEEMRKSRRHDRSS